MNKEKIRHNWTLEEIRKIYDLPLLELIYQAATTHRLFHDPQEIQVCHLISVKTGGCPEDCHYRSQSSRYQTTTKTSPILSLEQVITLQKMS